jgi:hypothetical protein
LTDALPLYEETLKLMKAKLGPDHPHTLISVNQLARAYQVARRPADALPLLRELLDKRRSQRPAQPLQIADTLAWLGSVLTDLGEAADAEPGLREGLDLREKHLPAGHWLTANLRSLLGGCLAKQQKFMDAEPLLLQGYQGLIQAKDTPPERLRQAVERLVQLYAAWAKPDKADEWHKRQQTAEKPAAPQ